MIFRWIRREITRSSLLSFFFILNFSVGIISFLLVDTYKTSIQNYVNDNQKSILTADLAISMRREPTEAEVASIDRLMGNTPKQIIYEFFAMGTFNNLSKLVLVKAVEDQYPFYGQLDNQKWSGKDKIWISTETAAAFQIKAGDTFKIGELNAPVEKIVTNDSSQTFRSFGIAPRIYISINNLKDTQLIKFGSTFSKNILFKIDDPDTLENRYNTLLTTLSDSGVRVETAKTESQNAGRQIGYLSDFLGLASVVSIVLASLGAIYVWRFFLHKKIASMAILRTLGFTQNQIFFTYLLTALTLSVLALIPATLVTSFSIPVLQSFILNWVKLPFEPTLTWLSIFRTFFLMVSLCLLITLPSLFVIKNRSPVLLFIEAQVESRFNKIYLFYVPLVLASLWGLSFLQSKSYQIASLFVACLVGAFLILSLVGYGLFWLANKFLRKPWMLRQSLKHLLRRPLSSLTIFSVIGLGSLLMSLLPQAKSTIMEEISGTKKSVVPHYFLFDIQDEQKDTLLKWLNENSIGTVGLSPLVRSRILKVNDLPFERLVQTSVAMTREEEQEARFRNRGVNLSYRETLGDSESIIAGEALQPANSMDEFHQISVEEKYAGRMGLKIGDEVLFDIQGVEFKTKIVNFRKINWTSFQPNFFILFQPGILDEAPKTWLLGVTKMSQEQEALFQKKLSTDFSNISSVDITKTVSDLLKLFDQISYAMLLISLLSLMTGFVVLIAVLRTQLQERIKEINLLKILGANKKQLLTQTTFEYSFVCFFASAMGCILSLIGNIVFSKYVFDQDFKFDFATLALICLCTTALSFILGLCIANKTLNQTPQEVLFSNG